MKFENITHGVVHGCEILEYSRSLKVNDEFHVFLPSINKQNVNFDIS